MTIEPHATRRQIELSLHEGSIIVGHDGSANSSRALEVALGMAETFDVPVLVVRTWSVDNAPKGSRWQDGYVASVSEISATVREKVRADSRDVVAEFPDVSVHYLGVLGHPGEVLTELSRDAVLLVVGAHGFGGRGLGGFTDVILGSVSARCVQSALCPVTVIPPGLRRIGREAELEQSYRA